MPKANRKVVITGVGMISPLGNCRHAMWEKISSGISGVDFLSRLPIDSLPTNVAGEARDFTGDISDYGELDRKLKRGIKKGTRLMCREIQMGVAAAQFALSDAGIEPGSIPPERIGTMFGSDYIVTEPYEFNDGVQKCIGKNGFEFDSWAEKGLSRVEPLWLLKYLPNMPASHVAIYNDLQGPSNSITVREASANLAIAEATTTIGRNSADVMLAGCTGSRIHPLRTIHAAMQEDLAPHTDTPATASRPFDAKRNGVVIGEGAGVLVLEAIEHAEQRGAEILGEVLGYASTCVADVRGKPDFETAFANVIELAIKSAGIATGELDHLHAHGLSAVDCDAAEAAAIRKTIGEKVPVVAAKSYMGNLGSGSGIVEIVASLAAIKQGQRFPVLNFESFDDGCTINIVRDFDATNSRIFINTNITPQGQASAVVIRVA